MISFLSNKCEETSNYTLLIGAGCSVTSGIDSGGDLIKKWKKEIYESENTEGMSEDDFWKSQYEWYDSRNPYSSLFQKNMIYHVNVVFLQKSRLQRKTHLSVMRILLS